jgi:hypothetical protein
MRYIATATVTLGVGAIVGLSTEQAAARKHALQPGDRKGFYAAIAPIQLKAGEKFEYDDVLPKSMVDVAEPAAEHEKAQRARKTAQSDAMAAAVARAEAAERKAAELAQQLEQASAQIAELQAQLAAVAGTGGKGSDA